MGPWPMARFGAAAELLGRRDAISHPLVAALGPELLRQVHVVLGSDLESIGIATPLDADSDAIARSAAAIQQASGAGARAWVEGQRASTGGVTLGAMVLASGATYSVERRATGTFSRVATARDVDGAVADAASARFGILAESVDHVIERWSERGTRALCVGAVTDSALVVKGILERSGVAPVQRQYFEDTVPVWTLRNKSMLVRLTLDATGIADEVGIVFRDIPGEHLVRIWRTLRPRADLAQRIGSFVGAMGIENAAQLELRLSRVDEPVLEATFVPSDAPFSR